ncbi:hypothetical protein [Photobacterium leiognathi]|uniref:hypothetical protein n=1 Tax=Photobacterium leiognathi TaxID=553611 RepID=UPI002981ECB2|nr:hypothetical protein [Photobacterium leiognathi]
MSDIKLTKKMWFFSVLVSGGIIATCIDFIKFSYKELTKDSFEIELVDVWCRNKECNFTILNKGDEAGVVTAFSFDGARYEQFKTTHPIIAKSSKSEFLTTSSAAYLPNKSFAEIVFGNPPNTYPQKEICFYSQSDKWCSKNTKLAKIISKEL